GPQAKHGDRAARALRHRIERVRLAAVQAPVRLGLAALLLRAHRARRIGARAGGTPAARLRSEAGLAAARAPGMSGAKRATGSSPPRFSRRRALGVGLTGLVPLGCAEDPRPTVGPAPPTTHRIVIVGAGLAGLHCAYRLRQAGVEVTVYEANHRIGGRILTARNLF